ncbi:putative D-xylulose reductase A [Phytophthora fragariae]|uniref:Putative D-xylulose reductase A n=1 Tax=Phytophthora fragariae TaxID=53985 RepID=A0A6G0MGR8_9STRA|nr:putative D-xylulose reductase A [Phytophthora fragariae]
MSTQNPSFVLEKVGVVRYEDRPVPTITNPHDVIVNVRYTGICGSDVHYYTARQHRQVRGGEAHGAGPRVRRRRARCRVGGQVAQPGDQVAMEPGVPCRRCVRCLEGNYNLCPDMSFAATPPIDGTLAKFYVMPEDFCYKLLPHVSMQEGALLEPTAVAVHFCRLAKVSPGDSVVVFGVGPVGLLACKVAHHVFGATTVVGVDVNEARLAFAKEHGATHVFQSKAGLTPQETANKIIEECGLGEGADIVIDASGAEPCIQAAVYVARNGGSYTQGGMGKTDVMFPIGILCGKELHVTGSFRYSAGDYQLALDMIASGKLSVKELISKTVPFEEAKEAFENVKCGNGVKWLIEGPKN